MVRVNFNKGTRCSFKVSSQVVDISSDETHSYMNGNAGTDDAINKTLDLLIWFMESLFDVRRALQQVVMRLPMIRHTNLNGISLVIPLDVLKKV